MQSLFLTEKDVFEVKIFVAVDNKGTIYCDKNKDGVKFLLGGRNVEIEKYSIFFKKPSFGDFIALTDLVTQNTDNLTGDINPLITKLKAMSYLLNDWNFLDKDNEKIPPTEDSFSRMDPIIAVAIGIQFDEFLGEENDSVEKNDSVED